MTDIAQIGFKVNTADLDKAVVKLNSIRPAAAGAGDASAKLSATVEGASAAIQTAAVAVARAEKSKADSVLASARATSTASKADIEAAVSAKKKADATYAAARAERDRTAAANAAVAAAKKTEAAVMAVTEAYKRQAMAMKGVAKEAFNVASGSRSPGGGAAPANDQMPNRFNTANIAAQFQDIGVTAAMGMNPMTIALQQGTQLSAILNTMEKPLEGIKIAFQGIFNAMSLGTIAIVALVAAGLQMVDWTKTAQTVVRALADVLEVAGPYAVALAGALALIYAPAILAGLKSVVFWIGATGLAAVKAGAQMAGAWLMAMGPIGWVIIGITTVVTAMNIFRDELKSIFGVDIVEAVKTAVNKIIGFFVGLFEGIVSAAKNLPDQLRGKGMSAGDAFAEGFTRAMQRDYVGAVADPIVQAASTAADKLRALANGFGADTKKKRGKTPAERYADIINGAERSINSLKAEQAALGLTENAAARLKYETDLLNEAQQKNLTLTAAQRVQLGELAQTMADTAERTRKIKDAVDFAKGATKSFVSELRSGLQEGKTLWESFGNAVQNVLDKILDKLIDVSIDQMFEGAGGGAGAGGFLSGIADMLFNAKGNAFGSNGVEKFAKGGAFTNSVVSTPKLFAYANGGSFGVMGEAGPEAVMPLHRGSDGSLGVRMEGGGAGVFVNVNIENNSGSAQARVVGQRQTANGIELDMVIDDITGSKVGDRGSSLSRALDARDGKQMIQR